MRIRHYGFLDNRFRKEKLALCRELLGVSVNGEADDELDDAQSEHEIEQCEPQHLLAMPEVWSGPHENRGIDSPNCAALPDPKTQYFAIASSTDGGRL